MRPTTPCRPTSSPPVTDDSRRDARETRPAASAGGGDDCRDAAAQLGGRREGRRRARRSERARGGAAVAGTSIPTAGRAGRCGSGCGGAVAAFPRAHGPRNIPGSFARHLRRLALARARLPGPAMAAQHPERIGHLGEFLGRHRPGGDQARHRSAAEYHHVLSAGAVRPAPDTGLRERNLFVQAQMELVGNLCQATTTICLTSGTFARTTSGFASAPGTSGT